MRSRVERGAQGVPLRNQKNGKQDVWKDVPAREGNIHKVGTIGHRLPKDAVLAFSGSQAGQTGAFHGVRTPKISVQGVRQADNEAEIALFQEPEVHETFHSRKSRPAYVVSPRPSMVSGV